jgi:serine/threonine-protein kinase
MAPPRNCPAPESWQALFGDGVAPEQRAGYERHLEGCPACQDRLDRAAECQDELRRLGRRVGDPTVRPADPTLVSFLDRLHEVRWTEQAAPADLYFLRPADRPELLGMLGKYAVTEVIGQGGMGVVLKALDPDLHRHVAIKVLAPVLAGSSTARQRFTREAQASAAVCHDHVVAVHGVAEVDGLPYLVMPYVAGESLQARLDRAGPLAVEEVVRIGCETASGLAAAHARGLIHRDIKPANILLAACGLASGATPPAAVVKITDFGLARAVDAVGLTRSGVVAGTPEYMAPEQARGEAVDQRSDVFSLGSVLYACCTGQPPFRGATALAVLRQVSDEAVPPLRTRSPEVPAWLEALVARLLAKDPADRIQSAAEVAALLERYRAHLQQPELVAAPELPSVPRTHGAGRRTMPPRPITRKWLLMLAGLVGVLGLLGALGAVAAGLPAVPPPDAAAPPQASDPATVPAGTTPWLAAAGISLGLLLTLALPAGWYARSRRRPGRTTAAVAVACPNCGKHLRVRAELAGKKVKCPGCRQAVPVPAPEAPPAPAPARPPWRFRAAVAAVLLLSVLVAAALFRAARRDRGPVDTPDQSLGLEPTPGVEEQGLFAPEIASGSDVPYRWTDGAAKLVIPLSGPPPQAVAVRLWISGHQPVHVGIKINGESVCSEQAPPTCDWLRTFDLTGKNLGKALAVEVLSDTFVPARQNPGSGDPRTLGVCFEGLTLIRSPRSYVNVPLGTHPVPGVSEEGFHYPERGREEYRWTNGAARLFVPIPGKRPRALAVDLAVPKQEGFRIKVVVNGQTLRDEVGAPNRDWSAELPLDGVNLGDVARIELLTSLYVPAQVNPRSTDRRELGVRVTRVMLLE